jgi:hypothetical protein
MADTYAARVLADAHSYQGSGTTLVAGCAAAAGTYVNPFAGEAWAPSRNDQGVEYEPLKVEAIRAIGAGTIVDIGSWGNYGPWFDYKLAAGQFAGKCIYVAEHIGSILPPGTSFNAGDTLATAYPGPDWTEWGWAKALDTPSVTWQECGCMEQDNVNPGGRAFARLLGSLGATTEQDRGQGRCMRVGRADGIPRTASGEMRPAASRCGPAPHYRHRRGGSGGRHGSGDGDAEPFCRSPLEAPAPNCQAPSKLSRAGTRRARARLGFECPVAGSLSGCGIRTRLRTLEQSPCGHHSGR